MPLLPLTPRAAAERLSLNRWPALARAIALLTLLAIPLAAPAQSDKRLGRVAWSEGQVTLSRAGGVSLDPRSNDPYAQPGATVQEIDTQRNGLRDGLRNWPLTDGDRLRTAAGARLELGIGSTRLRLAPRSDLQVLRMDDGQLLLQLNQGSLAWRVDQNGDSDDLRIQTEWGEVEPQGAGLYRLDRWPDRLVATAWRGQLRLQQNAGSMLVNPGQAATVFAGQGWRLGVAAGDDFAVWAQGMDQLGAATADVPAEMTGANELASQGQWQAASDGGRIWFPSQVVAGWAPYQRGRWVWMAPWGWTWIDDAPWGFVTFQYGQWVQVGPRWGWRPGPRVLAPQQPFYGPYDRRNPGYRYPAAQPHPPVAPPVTVWPAPGYPTPPAAYPPPRERDRDWHRDRDWDRDRDPRWEHRRDRPNDRPNDRVDDGPRGQPPAGPPPIGWRTTSPNPGVRVDDGYPIGRTIRQVVRPPADAPEAHQQIRGPAPRQEATPPPPPPRPPAVQAPQPAPQPPPQQAPAPRPEPAQGRPQGGPMQRAIERGVQPQPGSAR